MDHFFRLYWILVTLLLLIYVLGFFGRNYKTSHFPDQGSNPTSSTGRQILNHWTREVPKTFFFLILKILSGEAGREGKRVRGHTEEKTCLIFQNEERKSGIVNRMQSARNFRWAAKRAEGIASQQNRQTQRRKGYNQGYRPSRTVFGGVGVSLCFKLPLLECSCFTVLGRSLM